MTWSYSGDPSASPQDEVRFYLGDVDASRPLLTDEAIAFEISRKQALYSSLHPIAADLAERIAASAASYVATSGDGVSISADQLQQKFTALAQSLRDEYTRVAGAGVGPYVGSNDMTIDQSINNGWAGIGMHDNPAAGNQNDAWATMWWDPSERA